MHTCPLELNPMLRLDTSDPGNYISRSHQMVVDGNYISLPPNAKWKRTCVHWLCIWLFELVITREFKSMKRVLWPFNKVKGKNENKITPCPDRWLWVFWPSIIVAVFNVQSSGFRLEYRRQLSYIIQCILCIIFDAWSEF